MKLVIEVYSKSGEFFKTFSKALSSRGYVSESTEFLW